jgi:hypothetical protein
MLRITQRHTRQIGVRLDSDRDTLPFPSGGVYGSTSDVATSSEVAAEAFAQIDRIQQGIDQLSGFADDSARADIAALSGVIGRISAAPARTNWLPPSAA